MLLALVTATYAKDVRRFSVLRHSIERFAPDVLHRVCVQTEDLALFERQFGGAKNLELIPSCDLLPETLEAWRRRSAGCRFRVIREVQKRVSSLGHFNGYLAQQLTKFELARRTSAQNVLIVDADTILTRPLDAIEMGTVLRRDSVPVCYSSPCSPELHATWRRNAWAAIDVHPGACPSTDGMAMPFPASPVIIDALVAHIERVWTEPWQLALVRNFKTYSEFLIYENFCRFKLDSRQVSLAEPPQDWATRYWQPPNDRDFEASLREQALSRCRFLLFQSNFKQFDYEKSLALIERYLAH